MTASAAPVQPAEPNLLVRLIRKRESGVFLALVLIVTMLSVARPVFFSPENLYIVSRQIALTALVGLGVFYVILTGGIDLSVGSIVGLSGFLAGMAMGAHYHPVVAVGVGLLAGALLGAINGGIVAYIGVTPFIVTLGMLGVARGTIYILKHGDSVRDIPAGYVNFGNGDFYGLPVPVLILIGMALISHVVLVLTPFGRRIYAIGGNEEATALSGINTRLVKFFTYVVSGILCSITGLLFIARFNSAQADSGRGMELDAIAAAVIGGTSLMGGQGSVLGVMIGATIMGVVRNGLVLLQVSSYWQETIIGMIIVAAAILDVIRNRKRAS